MDLSIHAQQFPTPGQPSPGQPMQPGQNPSLPDDPKRDPLPDQHPDPADPRPIDTP